VQPGGVKPDCCFDSGQLEDWSLGADQTLEERGQARLPDLEATGVALLLSLLKVLLPYQRDPLIVGYCLSRLRREEYFILASAA
jgi:hypothetical protein